MESFKRCFGVNGLSEGEFANVKGMIVAISTLGAVFGCLACV